MAPPSDAPEQSITEIQRYSQSELETASVNISCLSLLQIPPLNQQQAEKLYTFSPEKNFTEMERVIYKDNTTNNYKHAVVFCPSKMKPNHYLIQSSISQIISLSLPAGEIGAVNYFALIDQCDQKSKKAASFYNPSIYPTPHGESLATPILPTSSSSSAAAAAASPYISPYSATNLPHFLLTPTKPDCSVPIAGENSSSAASSAAYPYYPPPATISPAHYSSPTPSVYQESAAAASGLSSKDTGSSSKDEKIAVQYAVSGGSASMGDSSSAAAAAAQPKPKRKTQEEELERDQEWQALKKIRTTPAFDLNKSQEK